MSSSFASLWSRPSTITVGSGSPGTCFIPCSITTRLTTTCITSFRVLGTTIPSPSSPSGISFSGPTCRTVSWRETRGRVRNKAVEERVVGSDDMRKGSSSFGKWDFLAGIDLDSFIPCFFCLLDDVLCYDMSGFYLVFAYLLYWFYLFLLKLDCSASL